MTYTIVTDNRGKQVGCFECMKHVKAHLKRDGARLRAYGHETLIAEERAFGFHQEPERTVRYEWNQESQSFKSIC